LGFKIMRFRSSLLFAFLLCCHLPAPGFSAEGVESLEKSAYFAYVDRDYIFTIEVVSPGTPLFNFVSMTDREDNLQAKNITLSFGNRQAAVKMFSIEADRYQQPMRVSSLRMHARSSFGFRLEGSFGKTEELYGAEIKLGEEKFKLVPLSKFDFETLVLKVNRLNLGSPDFRDDFRVLDLKLMGQRSSQPR
jgi:hypothetical protein